MAQGSMKLTRDQLAAFLKDHQSIKQFEKLFATVDAIAPDFVNEVSIAAGDAQAAANEALAQLTRIANSLEMLATAPVIQNNNSVVTDYIDFDETPPHADKVRRIVWNSEDDTLNIHHSSGVAQQVGLEFYVRFSNDTGVTIPNGTVVGLDFVGGVTTDDVVPFIADGSVPMLNIVGVTTHDVINGEYGRATTAGQIHDMDTTGAPYGETWSQGDVLYASPTTAGGFTTTKPTAPSWCVPVGIVLFAHATLGRIYVRPTVDQPLYYGEFVKTTDTSPAAINTAYALTFNSANIANGISIGAPASRLVAEFSGLYRFSPSMQITSTSASTKKAWFWFRKNGTDIANSATIVTVTGSNTTVAPSIDILISLDAADYVEIVWAADDTGVSIDTTAATAFAPQAPGIIMVITQEQQ